MAKNEAGQSGKKFGAPGGISDAAIRQELERILESPEFQATDKMRDFLRYVVEETLAGRANQIKGFTIANAVYGRRADFDPAHDPVVRIQAGRLRRAMERYYLVAGGDDRVQIDIPKGTYVPTFSIGPRSVTEGGIAAPVHGSADPWPTVLVRPFKNLSTDNGLDFLGEGLAVELCLELGRYQEIHVLVPRATRSGERQTGFEARFEVCGSIRRDPEHVRLVVQLVEAPTCLQVWIESFDVPLDSNQAIRFQEEAASIISAHIASYHGILYQTLSKESINRPIAELSTYQAMLKAYAYDLIMTPESYTEALEALRAAHIRDPECGLVTGALAHLYADNIAFEFFDPAETPFDDALHFAQTSVQMEPHNQISRIALARLRMLNDELDAALTEIDAALKLNPDSLYFMDVIGMWLALLGEWERGLALIDRATQLNPFYRAYVHFAIWLNHFRLGEYELAFEETNHLLGSGDFWDPLCRATTLGHLGRLEEGRNALAEALTLKPDLPDRARIVIGHGVKDEDAAERVYAGLKLVGLN